MSQTLAPAGGGTPAAEGQAEAHPRGRMSPALLLGALGVVYGDIGTSPLYAYKEAVKAAGAGNVTPVAVIGAVSLIFWALILVVSLKYAILILRADNRGRAASWRCWRSSARVRPGRERGGPFS